MTAQPLWTFREVVVAGRQTERLVVDGLTLFPGTTAIVGPSGAGKSTLCDLLCGVIEPDAGELIDLGLGRLFLGGSDGGLWPDETARSHLQLVSDEATTERWLTELDLLSVADARPASLSQGEQSRLSIARALAADPDTMVLDEPLAHIDPQRQERVKQLLRDWVDSSPQTGRPRRSLVVATHAANWVAAFEHTVCLDRGRVIANATTDELRSDPPSEAVAWLLGLRAVGAPSSSRQSAVGVILAVAAIVLATMSGCLSGCSSSEAGTIPLDPDAIRTYQLPPDGPRLPAPRAVTVDAEDNRFILDNAGRVLVYSPAGRLLRRWAMPDSSIGKPEGIRVFPDGRVAVADTHYSQVVVFHPSGEVDFTFGSRGDGPGQFLFPVAIEQDADGFLYVAEYGGRDRVQKFTAEGEFVLEFGSHGTGREQFQRASGLSAKDGVIWVADAINNRVHRFGTDGAFLETIGTESGLHWPYDLDRTPDGRLIVPEYGSGTVAILNADGSLHQRLGGIGRDAGEFYTPWGLAIDSHGTIIVADTGNHRIVEFHP